MALQKIVLYPDPRLREKAKEVTKVDDRVRKILDDMAETMYAAPGIGLAGPQIGVIERLVVIDLGEREEGEDGEPAAKAHLYKLVNPHVIAKAGSTEWEEGCLSIPDVKEKVKRSNELTVSALDEQGKEITIKAKGLLAVCLQHEIDHLDGVLFIDRLSRLRKELIRSKLDRLRKQEK